ncbi:hypothetical protein SLA2020_381050 [Shorea laevis]
MRQRSLSCMEVTIILGWMTQWLSWVKWYSQLALDPCLPISDLIDYPVCSRAFLEAPECGPRAGTLRTSMESLRQGLEG